MNRSVYLEKRELYKYPGNTDSFNPSVMYPEYPFSEKELSSSENGIYDMVRNVLVGLGMDEEHYGSSEWNPLGEIITPGDTVVIKPNLVKHCENLEQYRCTLTHPSVVRAIADYCIIAKAGKIILGDAPIQGADMEKIKRDYFYDDLLRFYKNKDIEIDFRDFRDLIVISNKGIIRTIKPSAEDSNEYVKIELGKKSLHYDPNKKNRYETCGYTDEKINVCHTGEKHEYIISKYVLDADVIINLPKPKTHRFAGITGAQKNFVGTCSDKESLPHFRAGAKSEGGDETNRNTLLSRQIAKWYRKYLLMCKEERFGLAKIFVCIYSALSRLKSDDLYTHGAWHGNDTIWRTILDLNKIMLYARKDGTLDFEHQQRRIFTIGDMIISGEKEGPLQPTAKKTGCILASKSTVLFDVVFCKITGFQEELIPTIKYSIQDKLLNKLNIENEKLYSNVEELNQVSLSQLNFSPEWHFEPHSFWKEILK